MATRPIFSQAALDLYAATDEPIRATDAATGIELIYRFDHARGGVLTCHGGPLAATGSVSCAVPLPDLNPVARRLCDRLMRQHSRPS